MTWVLGLWLMFKELASLNPILQVWTMGSEEMLRETKSDMT